MSDRPGSEPRDPRSVAEMAIDVSERVSYLVREEVDVGVHLESPSPTVVSRMEVMPMHVLRLG